jgi:hypothetical protein
MTAKQDKEEVFQDEVFYIAWALVVGVATRSRYRVWLPDFARADLIDAYLDGTRAVPATETVEIDLERGLGPTAPAPASGLDVLTQVAGEDATELQPGLPMERVPSHGRIAIHESLWSRIPEAERPLPPRRDQPYRLRAIVRRDAAGAVRATYMGYHAKIIAQDPAAGTTRVQLSSWTDQALGGVTLRLGDAAHAHPRSELTSASAVGAEGALYLSEAAMGLAAVAIPKVPIAGATNTRLAAVPAAAPPPAPIVLVGRGTDAWLRAVSDRVDGEVLAGSKDELEAELRTALAARPEARAVELISHAIGREGAQQNLLRVGDWVLSADAAAQLDPGLAKLLAGKVLRVVGCSTAIGGPARAALAALESRLGIPVYGTTRLVGVFDLGPAGVLPERYDALLARASEVPDPVRLTSRDLARAGAIRVAWTGDPRAPLREALVAGLSSTAANLVERVIDALGPEVAAFRDARLLVQSHDARELQDEAGAPAGRIEILGDGAVRLTRRAGEELRSELLLVADAPLAGAGRAQLAALLRGAAAA